MSSLVLELQSDACTGSVRVSDLLRKALVISKKLAVSDIEQWITHELAGYPADADIPEYRKVHGEVKAWNPYHGWIGVQFSDNAMAESLSHRYISQAARELDALVESQDKGSALRVAFPPHISNTIMDLMTVRLEPSLHIPRTEVVGILGAIRNSVLKWALELEQRGILGENMTFSKEERVAASNIT